MAKKSVRKGPLVTFQYPFTIEVRASEFQPHPLVAVVDTEKLSSGNHRIEVGSAEGGCCPRRVFAIIRKGYVTGLDVEPCKDRKEKLSEHAQAVVREAYRQVRKKSKSSGKWKPIPVPVFFSSPARMRGIIIAWGDWCLQVCWGSGNGKTMTCVECCVSLGKILSCTILVISTDPLNRGTS